MWVHVRSTSVNRFPERGNPSLFELLFYIENLYRPWQLIEANLFNQVNKGNGIFATAIAYGCTRYFITSLLPPRRNSEKSELIIRRRLAAEGMEKLVLCYLGSHTWSRWYPSSSFHQGTKKKQFIGASYTPQWCRSKWGINYLTSPCSVQAVVQQGKQRW